MATIDSASSAPLWNDGSSSSSARNNRIPRATTAPTSSSSANNTPLRSSISNPTSVDSNHPASLTMLPSAAHHHTTASAVHPIASPPITAAVDAADQPSSPTTHSFVQQLAGLRMMSDAADASSTADAQQQPTSSSPTSTPAAASRSSSVCSIVVSTAAGTRTTNRVSMGDDVVVVRSSSASSTSSSSSPSSASSSSPLPPVPLCPSSVMVSAIKHTSGALHLHRQQHNNTSTNITSTTTATTTHPNHIASYDYQDKYPTIATSALTATAARHHNQPSAINSTNSTITTTSTTTTTATNSHHQSTGGSSPVIPLMRLKRNLAKTQSLDIVDEDANEAQHAAAMPAVGGVGAGVAGGSRPIYPNVPYSPYGSPYGSPRGRKRQPFRESRRISIEHNESFLQLNQYKLYDKIGQGSYGLVKLAYSEEDSTHYAMKIMSKRKLLRKAGLMGRGPKRGPTTSPLDRVYREIAVLKKLDHPNVVKLVEVLDDPLEDSLYLVFEWVELGAVLSVPTETPLSEDRAWSVFRDALLGLEYLHYQRIIHSDLKPDNLLVDKDGRVQIADLGVCNEFDGNDASMSNVSTPGTPAFRAPETLQTGQHSYNGRAVDVWALGATLFALVFGNVPFVADNVPGLYERIRTEPLCIPETPAISPALRRLIAAMLEKDSALRATVPQIKVDGWVTRDGAQPLPSEAENCCSLVDVSEDDISRVVTSIPKLDTLILIKNMLKKHSFQNPYAARSAAGQARTERFLRAGRSNSAPGAYHGIERQVSSDNLLPPVSEVVTISERLAEEES